MILPEDPLIFDWNPDEVCVLVIDPLWAVVPVAVELEDEVPVEDCENPLVELPAELDVPIDDEDPVKLPDAEDEDPEELPDAEDDDPEELPDAEEPALALVVLPVLLVCADDDEPALKPDPLLV